MTKVEHRVAYVQPNEEFSKLLTQMGDDGFMLVHMHDGAKGSLFCVFAKTAHLITQSEMSSVLAGSSLSSKRVKP